MAEVHDEFQATADTEKHTFYIQDYNDNKYTDTDGYVVVAVDFKGKVIQPVQEEQKLDQESRYEPPHVNIREAIKVADIELVNFLNHFGLAELIEISKGKEEKLVCQVLDGLHQLTTRKHLLWDLIASKHAKSSIEVSFIESKLTFMHEFINEFVDWVKVELINKSKAI